jgi:hypothetical protein
VPPVSQGDGVRNGGRHRTANRAANPAAARSVQPIRPSPAAVGGPGPLVVGGCALHSIAQTGDHAACPCRRYGRCRRSIYPRIFALSCRPTHARCRSPRHRKTGEPPGGS